jgi:hypothetical protein
MENCRDIIDVYKQIDAVIPDEHNELKLSLEKYIKSLWNKAPEFRKSAETYFYFAKILENYVSNHSNNNEEWTQTMKKIFRGDVTDGLLNRCTFTPMKI